jgi:hypothetical protein
LAKPKKSRERALATIADGVPTRSERWPFPVAAALGSSVRFKGIDREVRLRLPFPVRAYLSVDAERFELRMPEADAEAFEAACETIDTVLAGISTLPVLPSEAEEILTILPRERLKWTKDGRLQSAGTKTVKMRGRAKAVTFHVHDPRHVEDVLDRDMPSVWREEDELAKAENRKFGAGKAARTRAGKGEPKPTKAKRSSPDGDASELAGMEDFLAAGLLG